MNILHNKHSGFARQVANHDDRFKAIRLGRRNSERTFDYNSHVFTAYPDNVSNAPEGFDNAKRFVTRNKYGQRLILEEFFPVPFTTHAVATVDDDKFPLVIRPYRHFGGRNFQVVSNMEELRAVTDKCDKYVSSLFYRDKEFRHIFIGGKLSVVLFKKAPDGVGQEEPWNHHANGTRFLTVTKDVNDKLKDTGFLKKFDEFYAKYPLDVVAVDTCWSKEEGDWTLLEMNMAPLITKQRILNVVVDKLAECRNNQT